MFAPNLNYNAGPNKSENLLVFQKVLTIVQSFNTIVLTPPTKHQKLIHEISPHDNRRMFKGHFCDLFRALFPSQPTHIRSKAKQYNLRAF